MEEKIRRGLSDSYIKIGNPSSVKIGDRVTVYLNPVEAMNRFINEQDRIMEKQIRQDIAEAGYNVWTGERVQNE